MQKSNGQGSCEITNHLSLLVVLHSAESFAEPRPGWFLACRDDIIRSCRLTHM